QRLARAVERGRGRAQGADRECGRGGAARSRLVARGGGEPPPSARRQGGAAQPRDHPAEIEGLPLKTDPGDQLRIELAAEEVDTVGERARRRHGQGPLRTGAALTLVAVVLAVAVSPADAQRAAPAAASQAAPEAASGL